MGSFWWAGMIIAIVAITFNGIVGIIKASKTASGSKKLLERIDSLETDLGESEQLLEDAVVSPIRAFSIGAYDYPRWTFDFVQKRSGM